MSNTWYTSLSGMHAASAGLQNTSANISNLQSAGFKRHEWYFSSLSQDARGYPEGVRSGNSSINFSAGAYQQTGNPTDLAIIGDGFFVLRLADDRLLYTRAGQFYFNESGVLCDRRTQAEVMGLDGSGQLIPIIQTGPKHVPGAATHSLNLGGTIAPGNRAEFSVDTVYDSKGRAHTLKVGLLQMSENEYTLDYVLCDDVLIPTFPQTLQFVAGMPTSTRNSLSLTLFGKEELVLNFGTDDLMNQEDMVRLNGSETRISVRRQDGFAKGAPLSASFDDAGRLVWLYDNGKTVEGPKIALACFRQPEKVLKAARDNTFSCEDLSARTLSASGAPGFGSVQSGQVEGSNVDSTLEFANMVVLQRMFQACSQIMDIDKQLLEELRHR
ncbi:flagellar hook protein FlgE [Legionella geestiana]|uniref:Flagellar hook protein FlgE n=1 Tax=Legionella geestiana TaxID=45065 RepID=A0A0W0TTQ9_9GAMM|nr:flagellar hook-basal body complex protein [Legionella geestiana]KTC99028.1 flagellar hook protein FlgE [Legionella geestiana]QBS12640.1 flagellar hook-basal body complex protein [Legionella geestiana]QDQ39642.1 flagellar hook-basal body complex protein [Legionella geestiana]STX54900.1 flagellar hook protein FlgE [Legionella geestiana]